MTSKSKAIELRPDRSLLDPSFDGYKLSLQQSEILEYKLETPVHRVLPDLNQYSYLHAKLFGLHNHLIGDFTDATGSVYFINNELKVCKVYKDPFAQRLTHAIEVYKIPLEHTKQPGDYNVSLKFASHSLAVMSDGIGNLYILNTGERSDDGQWVQQYCGEVLGTNKGFIVTDVVLQQQEPHHTLDVLLTALQEEDDAKFSTVLHWVTLSHIKGEWGPTALRKLKSNGNISYSYLEPSCEAIYIASDKGCKFIVDSENPIIEKAAEDIEVCKKYTWSQTKDDVTIKFQKDTLTKDNINIAIHAGSISIKHLGESLLEGQLYQQIDPDVTTWILEDNILQIRLIKVEVGLMWPELVIGDPHGEFIVDTCIMQQANDRLAQLSSENEALPQTGTTFNSQEVEECDFEEDKMSIFERIDSTTHETTHKCGLGCHQVLITANLDPELPPALGVRHDVDVCLWQPHGSKEEFTITHKGTLNAFGYIQASKQQRKFSVCPSDLSYVAICESTRHLFIYRQNKAVTHTELRNRSTGQRVKSVAQQQVISIPNEEILGIYATASMLFLLTENSVLGIVL